MVFILNLIRVPRDTGARRNFPKGGGQVHEVLNNDQKKNVEVIS